MFIVFLTISLGIENLSNAAERFLRTDIQLSGPDVLVEGFPMLVTLSFEMQGTVGFASVPKVDLATEYNGALDVVFLCQSGDDQRIKLGVEHSGEPEFTSGGSAPSNYHLKGADDKVTLTLDLHQIPSFPSRNTGSPIPSGKWAITAQMQPNSESNPLHVTVRSPTAEEKQFLGMMNAQGMKKKWFPEVIINDDIRVPDEVNLPDNTKQIRDYINLLRLAVRNPDAAFKQMEKGKTSWGPLDDAVAELKYECITHVKGKKSIEAKQERTKLTDRANMQGRVNRLEKGGGLLDRLVKLKSKKEK